MVRRSSEKDLSGTVRGVYNGRLQGITGAGMGTSTLRRSLQHLSADGDGRAIAIGDVLRAGDDRGFALALLLLAFPFVLPVPSLGMSAPIGAALALAGIGLAIGRPFWLPARVQRHRVSLPAIARLTAVVERLSLRGRLVRPRLGLLVSPRMRGAFGVSLFAAAGVLALPVPLPLSNFFPALAILLLGLGWLEGDGLTVLAGHVAAAGVCVGLALTASAAWMTATAVVVRVAAFVF